MNETDITFLNRVHDDVLEVMTLLCKEDINYACFTLGTIAEKLVKKVDECRSNVKYNQLHAC